MDIGVAETRNIRFEVPGLAGNAANLLGINTSGLSKVATQVSSSLSGLGVGVDDLSSTIKQFGFVKFKCRQCEFDFSDSFSAGKSLSVVTPTAPNTSSFKINIGYFEEESRYADGTELYDSSIKTDIKNPWSTRSLGTDIANTGSFLSGLPLIGNSIQAAGAATQNALASIGGLINPALGAANRFINSSR